MYCFFTLVYLSDLKTSILFMFSSLLILGVELLVDFTGRGHMKNMKSLSGGQKAVVGLVFILAIQVGILLGSAASLQYSSVRWGNVCQHI